MSLRSAILRHSLPLLPVHSFTRQTLSIALSSLPPSHPDYRPEPLSDAVIDTVIGEESAATQELVRAWEDEGLRAMPGQGELEGALTRRLEYSAGVGEHLVEAYALMTAPSSSTSIPIPSIPAPLKSLLSIRLPPMYLPPGTPLSYAGTAVSASQILSSLAESTGGRLPFLRMNPLGPMSYAWRIADEAMSLQERGKPVNRGVMDEPVGAGPEWYTTRMGLSLAYFAAEANLLQPIPRASSDESVEADQSSPSKGSVNPHLSRAITALKRNLSWYDAVGRGLEGTEKSAGDAMGFMEFIGRSWAGIIRSRYW